MIKRKVSILIVSICLVWLVASYIDVISHNMDDCNYQDWNAFGIFVDAKEKVPIKLRNKELKAQGIELPGKHYTKSNVELLAKLIMAENGHAKHDETLWLTGAVVLKRVKAKGYPSTIRGVIYQKGQYSTAGRLDTVKPSIRALEIANELLIYGTDDLPDNLVFQSMFPQGKKTYKVIDGEYFCLA